MGYCVVAVFFSEAFHFAKGVLHLFSPKTLYFQFGKMKMLPGKQAHGLFMIGIYSIRDITYKWNVHTAVVYPF